MQLITSDGTLQDVQRRLLDEIEISQKKIHPAHATTFNASIQNKIVLAKQILRLIERYPKMTVKELLYLIECRIEGEKIVLSSYRWSIEMDQVHYDNRDNLERLRFIVRDAGKAKWEDYGCYPIQVV
jgi:hypothetical protein